MAPLSGLLVDGGEVVVWDTAALVVDELAGRVPVMLEAEFASFRDSIREHGVLTPLDVTTDGRVLDGRHRLRAASEIGLPAVPCRLVAPADELAHILLRALQQRHLNPSQRALLATQLAAIQQHRQQTRTARTSGVANLPPGGKTRDLVARVAGVSARTAQDALTVQQADPLLREQVLAGKLRVHVAARRIRREKLHASIAAAPPLPQGPFDLVYADPPWQLGHPDSPSAPENHYPTMPTAEIAAIEIPTAEQALLYLWVVSCLIPEALEVMREWGFRCKTSHVWVKPSIGPGVWARNRHELLLVGRKGNHPPPEPEHCPDSVIEARRRGHSEKPDQVYQLLERAYPHTRKLELFARNTRPGWTSWGNQAPTAVDTP